MIFEIWKDLEDEEKENLKLDVDHDEAVEIIN